MSSVAMNAYTKIFAAASAAALCLTPLAAPAAAGTPPAAVHDRLEREGIRMDVSLEPLDEDASTLLENAPVKVRLTVSETSSGTPLNRLYPAGWLDLLPATGDPTADDPESCQDKVEAFIGGSILSKPEVDLNVYYVLTLNDDATISVVDPLFGFGGSKLLDMVFLDSPGEDWELTEDQQRLFVSMPRSNRIAVVDTADWEMVTEIEVGPRPGRILLQPDERYLWVVNQGEGETPGSVSVVDTDELTEVARIEAGRGSRDLAFRDDDAYAFVINDAGTVAVVDVGELRKVAEVAVGGEPYSLDYSALGDALYVTDRQGGSIAVIDGKTFELASRIPVHAGVERIRFAPGDRLGIAVNPVNDELYVVDAAERRVVQSGKMEKGPYEVAFSDELAYVVHRGSETVLMIPLSELGHEGRAIPVVDFPGGQRPPGEMRRPGIAEMVVQAPGATAVLVTNPGDQAIYYYKEGMAAPMGHFKNYGREPRAVEVVDRSFQEVEPGVYESAVSLSRPGRYDLALFTSAPRMVHCVRFEVAADPELERLRKKDKVAVVIDVPSTEMTAGREVDLTIRVADALTGVPKSDLADVQVLTFLAPGIWQQREYAQPLGEGDYRLRFTPPRPGVYYVFVEIASEGLGFNQSPSLILTAGETVEAARLDENQENLP